jgi:hypothetical protein
MRLIAATALAVLMTGAATVMAHAQEYNNYPQGQSDPARDEQYQRDSQAYQEQQGDYQNRRDDYDAEHQAYRGRRDAYEGEHQAYEHRLRAYERARAEYDAEYGPGAYERYYPRPYDEDYPPAPDWRR